MPSIIATAPDTRENDGRLVAKAVCNAADHLGLNQRALSRVIGLSPAQVSRAQGGGVPITGKPYQLALYLIRIFRSLDAITGGSQVTNKAWMAGPNSDLNGIPRDLIETPAGLVDVMNYLDAQRAPV